MPDVWSTVASLDGATQERLADVLETRGADAQQQAMRRAFLADLTILEEARLLEVGCGTGVLTRALARLPNVASVVGVDPAPALIARARELAGDLPTVEYREADGRELPLDAGTFDVVVFDSTLCHVPMPERALAEAFRVLRPGGKLAAFDGDYATATVGIGDHDPLQACVIAMMANSVNDRWLVRRLPSLVRDAGFEVDTFRGHSFIDPGEGGYMLTVVERGIDLLRSTGQIGEATAAALRAEAQRRVDEGSFFGHIAYGSVIATKPA